MVIPQIFQMGLKSRWLFSNNWNNYHYKTPYTYQFWGGWGSGERKVGPQFTCMYL